MRVRESYVSSVGELIETRFDFEALFDQCPIPLSVYDREGVVVAYNDAHAALWNLPRKELIAKFNMITDPQLAAKVTAAAMALPGDAPAAKNASIKGFEKPVELDGMATLLTELRMAPFDK